MRTKCESGSILGWLLFAVFGFCLLIWVGMEEVNTEKRDRLATIAAQEKARYKQVALREAVKHGLYAGKPVGLVNGLWYFPEELTDQKLESLVAFMEINPSLKLIAVFSFANSTNYGAAFYRGLAGELVEELNIQTGYFAVFEEKIVKVAEGK